MNIEPILEKFVKDDESKEVTESTQLVTAPQQEPPKPKPIIEEQKQKIIEIKKPQKKDTKDHPFNTKNKEQGRLKVEDKLASSFFHLSLNFLSPFEMIEESNLRISNEPKQQLDDLSLGKNNISKVENLDLENVQSIYGYNQKEEKDPVKQSLLNKLEELQNTQKEIKEQFKYDKNIYLKRIKMLEKAYQAKIDENKLKNMEKSNKKNKDMIKEFKKKIELAEREKIKDREKFNEALKNVFKLKKELMEEVNELEVMIKTTSVEDYDKYMLDNPTKIEKTNFRPNDSRYLLTNEYETSRDEEESISSYDKLNNINNTPDAFDINRQNIYLNKTMNTNYLPLNTKNSKIRLGTNNDFIIDKNNINNQTNAFNKSFQKRNSFSKGTDGNIILKQKEPKEVKVVEQTQNNINIQNNIKRVYPKDPEFINNDMILIRSFEDRDSDNFY